MSTKAGSRVVVVTVLVLGTGALLWNRYLPLVRNSLVYARATERVIEQGYDPRPVVADSKLSYDKPILYSWLSAPLVKRFGSHDGLRITSWLGSVAYLLSLVFFARSLRDRLPAHVEPAFVWLCAAGPCVLYQFWSAHPDTWFAALVVTAWALTHRIATEPAHRVVGRCVALALVTYIAILFKNYGLILLVSCPVYLLWHVRSLWRTPQFRRVAVASITAFALLGVLVLLAWTGHNAFSRLEGEGGGVGQYGAGVFVTSARGTLVQFGLALLLQFHVALMLALRSKAWGRATAAPLVCFGAIYVAGLLPFPTTFYNMRYFIPLFPLLALVIVRGLKNASRGFARGALLAHGVVATMLIATFNLASVNRVIDPLLPYLEVNWIGTPLNLLDNLRMTLHREQAAVLDNINARVPAGTTLYMMDVVYYGDAQQGVFEKAGWLRGDVVIHYVSRRRFAPTEPAFYVWSFLPKPPDLTAYGSVTDLGRGLYRVQRAG